jgi:hypothetical protein
LRSRQRPPAPMDDKLRMQGVILGSLGIALLFISAIAIILTPADVIWLLLIPLIAGFILIVVGYLRLRRAELVLLDREIPPRHRD